MILFILTFISILILYLHIYNHLYVSNIIDIKLIPEYNKQYIDNLVEQKEPFFFQTTELNIDSELNISNPKEKSNNIITKNDIIDFDKYLNHYANVDFYLKPYTFYEAYYNCIIGNKTLNTQLIYSLYCRNFFYVSNGSVTILLTPPRHNKYLNFEFDSEEFNYKTKINPWNPESYYKTTINNCEKIKMNLFQNQMLYIPPYWGFSFQLNEDNTCVNCFHYETIFNKISNANNYIKSLL